MGLSVYRRKRKFRQTPEPRGNNLKISGPLTFVVQKHNASRLHYDFRLEMDGVLKSWAVPKGPSLNPEDKRLAIMVEDHPLDYADFEGVIPKGNYGAGTVMVWDHGVYSLYKNNLSEQLKKGHLTFVLLGEKLKGEFALVKTHYEEKNAWLLIKANDEYSSQKDILKEDKSIVSKKSMEEIAKQPGTKGVKTIKNTPRGSMPHKVKPMLAQIADEPFDKPNWLFEIKWDGYRAIAEIKSGKVNLYSRNNISYNTKFSNITQSLSKFPKDAVLDGEIVVLNSKGRPNFQLMQDYDGSEGELVYFVFDILYFDGKNLEKVPLAQRKEILREVLPNLAFIRFSDYAEGSGRAFFSIATKLGLEGIMAKNGESTYQKGERSPDWLKIKTHLRQEAVIAGFTSPGGGRKNFGALILGVYKKGKLEYIGHTGGGFDDKNLESTFKKLKPLIQKECPFEKIPKTNAPPTWVRPKLICEVSFKEWTNDNKMRHPIFLGLREDKNPLEVESERVFSKEAPTNSEEEEVLVGKQKLILTNFSKIFWPKEKYTKGDLIDFYSEISSVILNYLKDRPQSLLRSPDGLKGESFYQKDTSNLSADWIKRISIRSESENKIIRYLLCQDKASLIYMVNLGCIDFNPWSSRVGHLENPDFLILDLDPEKVSFAKVVEAALAAKEVFEKLNIRSSCKTSGKRGLHIYVPTAAKYTYEQVRQFAELICLQIQQKLPNLISLKHDPSKRQGKVYLDYLRNAQGQTAASAYSVRAWPGATVSTPLKWEEVNSRLDPARFNIKTIPKRLQSQGDLFKGVLGEGIDIKKTLDRLI